MSTTANNHNTVFVILQENFSEGNYGDLHQAASVFKGVFDSLRKAENAIREMPKEYFLLEHGTKIEKKYYIIESEINVVRNVSQWFMKNYEDVIDEEAASDSES